MQPYVIWRNSCLSTKHRAGLGRRLSVHVFSLMMIALVGFQGELAAQETIISKKDADFVFSLTRPEWKKTQESFLPLVGL